MRKNINYFKRLAFSQTARSTYVLFSGNLLDAVLGFVFTVLVFRTLTTADFGIFSAINNFVIIAYSLLDIGIGGSLINFISYHRAHDELQVAQDYFQTGIFLRGIVSLAVALVVIFTSGLIGPKFFLTQQSSAVAVGGLVILAMSFLDLFYYAFQAYQQFLLAAITSSSFTTLRVVFILILSLGKFTVSLNSVMLLLLFSPLVGIFLGWWKLRPKLSLRWPDKKILQQLISFGGWIGLTRVFSVITGRMDVQLVLLLMSPADAGVYSVASRIASFYSVIVTSFTSVLAPKFAAGQKLSKLRPFVVKAALVIGGLVAAMVVGISIAKPFILLLFGAKAAGSVLPFQALTLAFMPFVASTLITTIIVYNLKRPKVLGLLTMAQFGLVLGGNLLFIPRFGSVGPAMALGLTNLVVLLVSGLYVWKKWT